MQRMGYVLWRALVDHALKVAYAFPRKLTMYLSLMILLALEFHRLVKYYNVIKTEEINAGFSLLLMIDNARIMNATNCSFLISHTCAY